MRKLVLLGVLLAIFLMPLTVSAQEYRGVSAQDIVAAAQDKIIKQLGGSLENYEITPPVNLPEVISIPLGEVDLSAEIPYGIRYNMPTIINVNISTDGNRYASIGLSFIVKKYDEIVVAARDIRIGEIITEDAIRLERRDIGRLSQGYLKSVENTVGLSARRNLTVGTVINEYNVQKPLVVKRGSKITILAHIGNIEVTAMGEAMQSGFIGQLIRVKNINTKKTVYARVISDSCAEVPTYSKKQVSK